MSKSFAPSVSPSCFLWLLFVSLFQTTLKLIQTQTKTDTGADTDTNTDTDTYMNKMDQYMTTKVSWATIAVLTDCGRTDRPADGRTDGRRHPPIEMRGRI